MRAQIRNFRGVKSADLDIDKIILISGDNGQGKSSTLAALAAAATGRGLPEGMTKGAAGKLVRDGAEDGFIMMEGSNGKTSMSWPSLEVVGTGRAPFASHVAAGLTSILDMDAKDRAKALITLLKAEPSKDDLSKALGESGILAPKPTEEAPDVTPPFDLLDQVWSKIDGAGWDGAHDAAVKRGAKLKGAWEEVTGKKYGKVAAEGCNPEGWLPEFAAETVESVGERLATARSALEAAITGAAVDTAERDRRAASAAKVDALTQQVVEAEAVLAAAHTASNAAADTLATIPTGAGYLGIPCPHCQGMVVVGRTAHGADELHKAQPDLTDSEKKAQRMARASAEGDASRLRGEVGTKQAEVGRVRGELETAVADAEWLANNPITTGNGADVPAARKAVADAEQLLDMMSRRDRAATRHADVVNNQIVIDLLAPTGLRQKKLAEVIDAFNSSRLSPLCAIAKWADVIVGPDLAITYGGRPFALLSESEQWRVRVVVQIAMAQMDGSELILIDGADVLTRRNGLFALLKSMQVPVVVGMSFLKADQAPDLAAAGIGKTYWISEGVAAPLGPIKTMQKAA